MTREELEKLSTQELEELLKKRQQDVAKANVMQLGLKVTLNSAYGMIGNEFSRYYDVRIAEGITLSGQLSIQWIKRKINEHLNQYLQLDNHDFCIAGDTDSVYISLKPFVDKITAGKDVSKEKIVAVIDKFCEDVLQKQINKGYAELKDYMNAYDQKMVMAREIIADRGLWRAKKNYALNVYNSEGVQYKEPKLKILGLQAVRSDTPEICRNAIKEVVRLILTSDEITVQKYISEFRKKFMNSELNDISQPKSFNDVTKWRKPEGFKPNTPYHVKAAMIYDRLLEKHGLVGKYRKFRDGDKGKLVSMKKGNTIHNKHLAYPDILPPELGLEEQVDKPLQFKKMFTLPAESLLDLAGWSSKKRAKLF